MPGIRRHVLCRTGTYIHATCTRQTDVFALEIYQIHVKWRILRKIWINYWYSLKKKMKYVSNAGQERYVIFALLIIQRQKRGRQEWWKKAFARNAESDMKEYF